MTRSWREHLAARDLAAEGFGDPANCHHGCALRFKAFQNGGMARSSAAPRCPPTRGRLVLIFFFGRRRLAACVLASAHMQFHGAYGPSLSMRWMDMPGGGSPMSA